MTSRNASFHDGAVLQAILLPLRWSFYALILLAGILVARWTVDGIFVFHVWGRGVDALADIVNQELVIVESTPSWHGVLREIAIKSADCLYVLVFEWSGIHEMALRFSDSASTSVADSLVRGFFIRHFVAIKTAMLGTQLAGLRLGTLLALFPLILLMYSVAVIDGLIMRCVRRSNGGLESSTIYHRAKYAQISLSSMAVTILLLAPVPLDIRALMIPVLGLTVVPGHWQWRFYKKHL